jgi:hypothetical protein
MLAMSSEIWRPLLDVDEAGLSRARVQAHSAVQWLARAARAYIPVRPNDGHTNFGWSDRFGGFVTHALPDGARLGLKVTDLALTVLERADGDAANMLPLDGCSDAQARAWLGRQMAAKGLDPSALDDPSPYRVPALANGAVYAVAGLANLLGELAVWYSNANAALGASRQGVIHHNLEAPPVRAWPHHFDLDTLVTIAPGRTTGIGFSPGDDFYDEPYFYAVSIQHPMSPRCRRCRRSVIGVRPPSPPRSRGPAGSSRQRIKSVRSRLSCARQSRSPSRS